MIWLQIGLSSLLVGIAFWSIRRYARLREKLVLLASVLCLLAVLWQESWSPWLVQQLQQLSQRSAAPVVIDSDRLSSLSAHWIKKIERSSQIELQGDGFRDSQWQDLPARRLQWEKPKNRASLQLQFNPYLSLGREFELTIQRDIDEKAVDGVWRAQLLAENGEVLAEEKSRTPGLKLRWLPPAAEHMVLQAKVFDSKDGLIDAGPIPLEVGALEPLQVWMRFDAPSFDTKALQNVLRQSQALIDSQTRLGQNIQHIESPGLDVDKMDVMIVDAAFIEQQNSASLQKILNQVAQGKSLLVLGANASQASFWRQKFDLPLQTVNRAKDAEISVDVASHGSLALSPNALSVMANEFKPASPWTAGPHNQDNEAWLWHRAWQKGQIAWLAVGDWHRYAITSPMKLAAWWQSALDQIHQTHSDKPVWSMLGTMPIAKERQIVCLQGVKSGELLQTASTESIRLSSYGEVVDQQCAAWRPVQAGWQSLRLTSPELKEPTQHQFFIYPSDAWQTWQRHLKANANQAFAQRLPAASAHAALQLALWPLYVLTALLLLYLWRKDTQEV